MKAEIRVARRAHLALPARLRGIHGYAVTSIQPPSRPVHNTGSDFFNDSGELVPGNQRTLLNADQVPRVAIRMQVAPAYPYCPDSQENLALAGTTRVGDLVNPQITRSVQADSQHRAPLSIRRWIYVGPCCRMRGTYADTHARTAGKKSTAV
jgi:hypothetical protein